MTGTRRLTAAAALALVLGILALDKATSTPLDPFRAPPILALGSGQASGGAHCAALPSK
ncbi:hypothetical protein [Pontibaca salina]|uniref:Uncharacterized protein n=1 Tax=Pontibaca salina TaxID=2795731 RepID=A0A934HKH1_9RHOB|nr:hypothetical protein [Pontibaca salina]MBI6628501.1 hypothetical protein [Pontibaca salina]